MEPIKLRRVIKHTMTEATEYFELDPEPFKLLVINEPYYGNTVEEFFAYIHNIQPSDIESICDELDMIGYVSVADNLDMLLDSADAEEIIQEATIVETWIEEF